MSFFQQYVVLVPENSYSTDVLKFYPGHLIDEFLQKCSQQNFYTDPFERQHMTCLSSIFTMTLTLLGKPPKCDCDPRGSASLNCKSFGGQCMCRSYVVGRRCDRCPIGYSGFPLCRSKWVTQKRKRILFLVTCLVCKSSLLRACLYEVSQPGLAGWFLLYSSY